MWAQKQIAPNDRLSIVRDARDYALLKGLVLRSRHIENDNCVAHIPFTLFPSPFPQSLYKQCIKVQTSVNKLMLSIANDTNFIEDTLSQIAQVDDFTRNLLKVNKIVQKEGLAQPIISCINRTDYMLDRRPDDGQFRVRQVEMNAIASSMSSHSCNTHAMHQYLTSKYCIEKPKNSHTPDNGSLSVVTQGLIEAYNHYANEQSFILLVTEDRSLNFSDQLLIELDVQGKRPDIVFIRKRFIDLHELLTLGPNRELILQGSKEIAVVYYRYCYDPTNYSSREAWDVRLLIERSKAIKCPSINFHLSGAKKFQQVLHDTRHLERFLDPIEAEELANLFCKFWSLDPNDPSGKEGFEIGLSETQPLVLKPQREGGGHNIFGQDIKPFLEQIRNSEERSQYILMEYIDSPKEKNWLLKQDDDLMSSNKLNHHDQLVSELGIFGSILANGSDVLCNTSDGYLIRSKKFGVNEGGVATGYAGIGSLILFNDELEDDSRSLYFDL